MLSVPTIIVGRNYKFHSARVFQTLELAVSHVGEQLLATLEIARGTDDRLAPGRHDRSAGGGARATDELLGFYRLNHHELTHRALVCELDAARDLGEEGIVLAAAHIESGLYASAALPHDNRSTGDDLSAECLEAEPLRIRVAAIS